MRLPLTAALAVTAVLLGGAAPMQPHAPTASPGAATTTAAPLAAGQPIPPAELEAFVDGAVRQAMVRDHIAGVTVSVVQNGQVVLKKGYGFASLSPARPVDPDRTLFRIGSISKTFTWTLVMKEVEAGRMRLDAPINLYLPEALRIPDQGYDHPILVRQLMNHTPGFEDRALGQLFERDWKRVRPLTTYLRQERPRRVREPGTFPSYSNYGAGLAGEAVSYVTGKTYESLVESEITGPLGLTRTTFREPHPQSAGLAAPLAPVIAADIADGYRWTPAGYERRPFEYIEQIAPAGAGSSTAGDMARYMLMRLAGGTLDGVQVYGPQAAQAFATPLPTPAPGLPAWRHGLYETPLPGGFTGVGHDGATLSFFSNMVMVPELGLGVFVSTNTDTGPDLTAALPRLIVERFYAGPPGPAGRGSRDLVADRGAYEGVYLNDRRAYHGLEGFVFRIVGAVSVRVTSDGRVLISGREGGSRWRPIGPLGEGLFVNEDSPDRLVFHRSNGRVDRIFSSGATFERTSFFGQTGALILVATLAAGASVATLGGLIARMRRDFRETTSQRRAGLIQASQSVLWLLAMALFAAWALGASDLAKIMYEWPEPSLMLASASALVAAVMALVNLGLMPFIWRGGRRLDGWTIGRKVRFTATAVIFTAFGLQLAFWGALEPWSG